MVKYVPYETEYVTKPKELELHANTITCLIFSYMFSVLYTLTVACIASNGIHLLNWMDGWIGSGVDPDPCILTSAYSSVPLAVGHLYTWVLRSWTSSHLGVQVLDIRAPGCCASVHLASWQLGVCAVRYPCFAILGGDGGKKWGGYAYKNVGMSCSSDLN